MNKVNCSECAFSWTSDDNDADSMADGKNGNVALNLQVTNSEFNTPVMNGLFGSLDSASSQMVNEIEFSDNNFVYYDSHYARDYIMNFDTEATELNVYFTSNEWVGLDVDSDDFGKFNTCVLADLETTD